MSTLTGRIRNTELVRELDPTEHRRLLSVLWVLLLVAGPAVAYVWLQTRFVAAQYEMQELRERLEQAREERLVLEARLAEVSSPARVRERVRRLDLDLVPADAEATRIVRIESAKENDGNRTEIARAGDRR